MILCVFDSYHASDKNLQVSFKFQNANIDSKFDIDKNLMAPYF